MRKHLSGRGNDNLKPTAKHVNSGDKRWSFGSCLTCQWWKTYRSFQSSLERLPKPLGRTRRLLLPSHRVLSSVSCTMVSGSLLSSLMNKRRVSSLANLLIFLGMSCGSTEYNIRFWGHISQNSHVNELPTEKIYIEKQAQPPPANQTSIVYTRYMFLQDIRTVRYIIILNWSV